MTTFEYAQMALLIILTVGILLTHGSDRTKVAYYVSAAVIGFMWAMFLYQMGVG